jgi:hypothetical protein
MWRDLPERLSHLVEVGRGFDVFAVFVLSS